MIAPFYNRDGSTVFNGDCLSVLREQPNQSVHCCVTSPPYYGLRDYGVEGQLGLEQSPDEYVAKMVEVFREVKRVLRDDGTLWLNLGDSYAAQRGGAHQPAETLAGGKGGKMLDGSIVNRDRCAGYNPSRNASAIGLKHKDLVGIPWRVAFALQADGCADLRAVRQIERVRSAMLEAYADEAVPDRVLTVLERLGAEYAEAKGTSWYLRQDIIWHKPNPMPESVRDRCTKAHEYIFLLSKSQRYYFDSEAMQEPATYAGRPRGGSTNRYQQNSAGMDNKVYDTRNRRSVWTVNPKPYRGAHFATFPADLITPCILAGCPVDGVVLDPFAGSGTTCEVARKHGRQSIGIELNPAYCELSVKRLLTSEFSFDEVDE